VLGKGKRLNPLEVLHPRSLKYLTNSLQSLVKGRLWLKVLIGMFVGIVTGIALGPSAGFLSPKLGVTVGSWLALPGQIFLGAIQMIVVPLVVASIIRGIAASENLDYLRRAGLSAVSFFLITTTIAILIGIGLAYAIEPGRYVDPIQIQRTIGHAVSVATNVQPLTPNLENLPEAITGLLPKNPLGAMVELEMLQVVIFSAIVGIALISMNSEQALPILDLLGSVQQVCMTVVKWAMLLAPIAVFGLMARITSMVGVEALIGVSLYVVTVLVGLLLLKVIYMTIYAIGLQKNPIEYLRATRDVMLLAFSTSSSAAVMPLSIKTAEERLGVRPSISQFVIPLGATINMNGTALYQGVAAIFLAQVFGIDLSFGAITLVVITAVGSSIGSPATPGVGIVILSMVLSSVGIPAAGIALIMGVDRILDMSRTAVNVSGDLVASCLIDRYVGGVTTASEQAKVESQMERERIRSSSNVIIAGGKS
jgi:Na+/H+-dicarboxylate symporter